MSKFLVRFSELLEDRHEHRKIAPASVKNNLRFHSMSLLKLNRSSREDPDAERIFTDNETFSSFLPSFSLSSQSLLAQTSILHSALPFLSLLITLTSSLRRIDELGAKVRVMALMSHSDGEVKYRALGTVSRLVSGSWRKS